ncbi:MAG: hypothetical protein B1H02_02495 [Candidatus Latescibacteria bacterium 4484_107]|nr:MAG: hypothetical protein B1H02_02495 [Candidatus Latescibacteria bacterium 4484_107]
MILDFEFRNTSTAKPQRTQKKALPGLEILCALCVFAVRVSSEIRNRRGDIMRTERWKRGGIVVLVLMIMQLGCGEKASEPEIGDITGTVTDSITGEKLSGVTVSTDPVTTSAQTDSQGAFTLSGVPVGEYVVKTHKEGYQDAVSEQKTVLRNEVTQADFLLRPLLPEPPQFP